MDEQEQQSVAKNDSTSQLIGLRGWLILPIIGLLLTIYFQSDVLFTNIPLLGSAQWNAVTSPKSAFYIAGASNVIWIEIFLSVFMVLFALYLLLLFFKKRKLLPKLIIVFYIITTLIVFLYYYLISNLDFSSGATAFADRSQKLLISGLVSLFFSVLWITYFRVSKRVKATFIT